MNAKTYYQNYLADDSLSVLSERLMGETMRFIPVHVLDFGCGTGKHIAVLNDLGVCTVGMDISFMNVITAKVKYNLPCLICADESYLRHLSNIDVVITCSVMCHIEKVDEIIGEFKRLCNKGILLAETNDIMGEFYYAHDYKAMGFERLDFKWTADKETGNGATYHIWKWCKQ